jgi:hypothetical protein
MGLERSHIFDANATEMMKKIYPKIEAKYGKMKPEFPINVKFSLIFFRSYPDGEFISNLGGENGFGLNLLDFVG